MLDLAAESGLMPGVREGQPFDFQDGLEVPHLHPPQMEELLGKFPALYFFSSAWDLR